METVMSTSFPKSRIGPYTVVFPIAAGSYAETYRVRDDDGKILFLKLIDESRLSRCQKNAEGHSLEADIAMHLGHEHLCRAVASGFLDEGGTSLCYLAFEFISGETVLEKLAREDALSVYEAKRIASDTLRALDYLHSLPEPVLHNEITLKNVMLDLKAEPVHAKLIDFGHAQRLTRMPLFWTPPQVNQLCLAPEAIRGEPCQASDLFSVGVMLFQMIFGMLPWTWSMNDGRLSPQEERSSLDRLRSGPLAIPEGDVFDLDDQLLGVLNKALQFRAQDRFVDAQDFLKALEGEIGCRYSPVEGSTPGNGAKSPRSRGRGFDDIAGMASLKKELREDVIDMLERPEEYRKHNLSLPNGMLLYGPPGCGKTFFAEKFAEEAGYHFKKVITSDLASIYVHGTQEKIRRLFDEARKHAPSILYFDEINSMVPRRDSPNAGNGAAGEVNEFLSQLDNIGSQGVFVIASTNYPDMIDPAVLRAGRLERKYLIPPPDEDARRALFFLYLSERPIEEGLDYDRLTALTEGYVCADIKLIVDQASRETIRRKLGNISMETLLSVIKQTEPSISSDELDRYPSLNGGVRRRPIGFQ